MKETSAARASVMTRSPIVRPGPATTVKTPGGTPDAAHTRAMIVAVASVTSDVVDAPFQMCVLPQIMEIARFQPSTAHGKLKAVMIATVPSGFHVSRSTCPARSLGSTWPASERESPAAKSHTSMNSCTSPSPSLSTLPISREMSAPRLLFSARSASPMRRTTSPRAGAGVSAHARRAASVASMQRS